MKAHSGYTMVELVATIAAIGLLAGVATIGIGKVVDNSNEQKLVSEVKTLNSAVAIYQGAGGQLDDDTSAAEVIAKLKSKVASSMVDQLPGLSSSMVDPRLSYDVQSDSQAATGEARVVWNASEKRFEIAYSGDGGIRKFGFDADPEAEKAEETDRAYAFNYAKESSWVWDFKEADNPSGKSPTTIALGSNTDSETSEAPEVTPDDSDDPETELTPLDPPTFSIPAGTYSVRDYDLSVSLSNPNISGSSDIYYSIDYGNWQLYTGSPIVVSTDTILQAQVVSRDDSTWTSSTVSNSNYGVDPVELLAPTINTSASTFGALDTRFIGVSLEDNNGSDPSYLEYRVAGGPWVTYTAPFVVDRDDYNSAIVIEARAVSDNQYYQTSDTEQEAIQYEPLTISSAAEGVFHSPTGTNSMRTRQDHEEHFAWGNASGSGHKESYLEFDGYNAEEGYIGSRFLIGELDYFNGTIAGGTGADAVKFDIELDMIIAGVSFSDSFTFDFDLINSTNVGDSNGTGQDAWDSADYVKIRDNTMSTQFTVGGVTLEFVLEFGDSTSTGFSEFDEFHVLENRSATTNVYGTVRRVDSSDEYDSVLKNFLGIVDDTTETVENVVDNVLGGVLGGGSTSSSKGKGKGKGK